MKLFNVRTQTAKTQRLGSKKLCRWAEIETPDMKITFNGQHLDGIIIIVEANGVKYRLTDDLLELMLGELSEEYSKKYLNFYTMQTNG